LHFPRLNPIFAQQHLHKRLTQKMAYSYFTFQKIRNELGIKDHSVRLFTDIPQIQPDDFLLKTLTEAEELAFFSEKSRSECIVLPILVSIWKRNNKRFAIYSGPDLEADNSLGLSGECDFILSKGEQKMDLDSPLFCMVEAKDQDLKRAIPQCIAQMYGAQIFNESRGNNIPIIWGCATTGAEWLFLKLDKKEAFIDTKRYYLAKLADVLGIFQQIIDNSFGDNIPVVKE
jgi:hypothetical protein